MGLCREVHCDMSAKGRVILAGQGVANSSSLCALDLCGTSCVCMFACMMLITARVPCPTVYALCVCVCRYFCISIRASVSKSVSMCLCICLCLSLSLSFFVSAWVRGLANGEKRVRNCARVSVEGGG